MATPSYGRRQRPTAPASDQDAEAQAADQRYAEGVNRALAETGLDIRADERGEFDLDEFSQAVAKRFPRILAKLAE